MWDPSPWAVQRGSFEEAVVPPMGEPTDAPLICLQVNQAYLPYVLGCLMQGMQPTTWEVESRDALLDILARWTDLIGIWGSTGVCVAPQFRLTVGCGLQFSLDGGTTWDDFAGWAANFPHCVAVNTPRIQMQAGYTFPPIPEQTTDGTDYVYSPVFP